MPPSSAFKTPTEAAELPLSFQAGRVVKLPDEGKFYVDSGELWEEIEVPNYVVGTLDTDALIIDGGLL